MFNWKNRTRLQDSIAQAAAINRSQAVIEFNMDGTIVTANENFLSVFGYTLVEIQGRHHRHVCRSVGARERNLSRVLAKLNRGEYQAAEYKRIGKGGKEIWIQASYNPILDSRGKPTRVIKFATEVTARKIESMDNSGRSPPWIARRR